MKFRCIYADPPWRFRNGGRGSAKNHYATMTIDDICALPVAKLAAENAHLHLWVPNSFRTEGRKVIEAWGFTVEDSLLVWIKDGGLGLGSKWRINHEFLFHGSRGRLPFLDKSQPSYVIARRTKHSRKPPEVRSRIEKVSPPLRLELFCRGNAPQGWSAWGDELTLPDCSINSSTGQQDT